MSLTAKTQRETLAQANTSPAAPAAGMAANAQTAAAFSYVRAQMTTGALTVFDTHLSTLYLEHTPGLPGAAALSAGVLGSTTHDLTGSMRSVGGETYVVVDITAKDGSGASLLPGLKAAGLLDGSSFGDMASGLINVADLGALRGALAGASDGSADDLGYAKASGMMTSAGAVTTQADSAEHADTARTTYSVSGAGLKIGVLSDSFNTSTSTDTMATDVTSGDLPAATTILQDYPNGEDEGRGMAQLVHDLAPGASIEFATAFVGEASFASNIVALKDDGAKVIVDDVIYFDEPAFQEGIIAQAVDQVNAAGVSYFSSAGNDGNGGQVTGYQGLWSNGGSYLGDTLMSFAPGQDYIPVTIEGGEILVLQWDNPAQSAGGAGASSDLDLYLTSGNGSTIYRSSTDANVGHDPVEIIDTSGLSSGTYYIRVGHVSGAAPGQIRLMTLGNGRDTYFTSPASNLNTGPFYGHAAAQGAIAVGAAYYHDTPQYGQSPPVSEYFSSGGPDEILFDSAGNPLLSPTYANVAFTAVDGGNTTFFGFDSDSDGLPNFLGTSAAAPDAAAVAILMLQARSTLTPADIENLLADSATTMANPSISGAGLIDANLAVGFAGSLTIANPSRPMLFGTHLADTLTGNASGSGLFGAAGNDLLVGGAGNDTFSGGSGVDAVSYAGATAGVHVSLLNGAAQNTVGAGTDTLVSIEKLVGSIYADTLTAATAGSTLNGGNGGDDLIGGPGSDILNGGGASDFADYALATAGVTVDLNLTTFQATGGAGSDELVGIEKLVGSSFNDHLTGDGGINTLFGEGGNDIILGNGGGDYIYGNAGNDKITGGAGQDTMTGGAGIDTFAFLLTSDSPHATPDLIVDFTHATDKIDLSAIDADSVTAGNQAFHFSGTGGHAGDITVAYHAGPNQTEVDFWTGVHAPADGAILLSGDLHLTLAGGDFVL